jgi:hypothetical protein
MDGYFSISNRIVLSVAIPDSYNPVQAEGCFRAMLFRERHN